MGPIQQAIKDCGSPSLVRSNLGITSLRTELEKHPDARKLIIKTGILQFAKEEPALSFAVSNIIDEVCAIFANNKGMHLNGEYSAYKKIIALLMIYDYCKTNVPSILLDNFADIMRTNINSKHSDISVQRYKVKIAEFISMLVSNSTYNKNTQEYTVALDGYTVNTTIDDFIFLTRAKEGAHTSFALNARNIFVDAHNVVVDISTDQNTISEIQNSELATLGYLNIDHSEE